MLAQRRQRTAPRSARVATPLGRRSGAAGAAAEAADHRATRSSAPHTCCSTAGGFHEERREDSWPSMMNNEQPNQELVKCVVVGDTAVGKTRLICARACDTRVTLSQLLTTHIPTVWAIDQYRIYKEVLERSLEVVDSVNVSLRLWDTFGDHDKDRRFAYGRSDVVLLCFSIANPVSLRNCKVVWYPEIRQYCPNTPIILVGCKNDLRYMYRDEAYLSLCRDRSPFFRPLRESDLLRPEQGRLLAKEIGAAYYETSVLTNFGVAEVFSNVIRAALLARKQQRFWMTNLKHVQHPAIQVPFCPPKPVAPVVSVPASQFLEHMQALFQGQVYTDVLFFVGKESLPGHRWFLAAACQAFRELFSAIDPNSECSPLAGRSSSDTSMVSAVEVSQGSANTDTEQVPGADTEVAGSHSSLSASLQTTSQSSETTESSGLIHHRTSCEVNSEASTSGVDTWLGSRPSVHLPAFSAVGVEQDEVLDHRGRLSPSAQAVVDVSKAITPAAMLQCIRYLYTGEIDTTNCPISEIQDAADLISVSDLQVYLTTIQKLDSLKNPSVDMKFLDKLKLQLKEVCLDKSLYADVLFRLDDGFCSAHRPLLMARCEMMAAMFSGDFRESSAKVVHFPGVSCKCFRYLLTYLYQDSLCNEVNASNCLELVKLADQLCLPRLVALIEERVVQELNETDRYASAKEEPTLQKNSSNVYKKASESLESNGEAQSKKPLGSSERLTNSPEKAGDDSQKVAGVPKDVMDVSEVALQLLEPCQIHNADQLADWCLYRIATTYKKVLQNNLKRLRNLHPQNQAYLNRNRWPPAWYIKEDEFYQRTIREQSNNERPAKKICFGPFSFKGSKVPKRQA
ncbi:rho-related BTB domain-containing protein 1 isoform X2 [Dermacentor andersoni]|uniref:rho-related BTB domain-containing protein 1 isoform X2 n=1 Tax=Dermacentor andersoni TaxID=34620 RepID=UPI0024168721|nr:rho-related BTB domain-containing protein 2-like isoform X2 [Dermacentor andersoni]